MDYRVSATDPQPPTRSVAWIGGISALALAVSPFLVWWLYPLGRGLAIGGRPGPLLVQNFNGRSNTYGRLLIFFGLICVPLWVQYGRNTRRWMRPIVAQLVMLLYLVCSLAAATLIGYAVLRRSGLPGLARNAIIGPGLYLALGASLTHSGCLIWLIYERLAWARMTKERR